MSNTPFDTHIGITAPMITDNIDTDQIIPSREMKTVSKLGLAGGLFARQRYINARTPNPDFILNQPAYKSATIILTGKNFGCGSSREHAVWALKDFGIRAIIAESFGEIFYGNCIRNGILPIIMDRETIQNFGHNVDIDLIKQTVNGISFDIAEGDKNILVDGLDIIRMTLAHEAEIENFLKHDRIKRPWIYT